MANLRRRQLLVLLLAIATHASALRSGFIWLDHAHIEDAMAVAPPDRWRTLFEQGFAGTGYYRPLMAVSLSIDAMLGQGAWLYHATTVLWHAAAAVLATIAASALGASQRAALGTGILFAVHPLSSLVAGAIAFRSEAMIAVALLALVILHRKSRLSAALALLFGALTKETALVLGPLFIVALELDAAPRAPLSRRVRLWAAEAAALGVALALRLAFAPHWRATAPPLAPNEAVGTRLASLSKTTLRVLVPIDPTVCDSFRVTPLSSVSVVAGFGIAMGIAYLAYKRRGPAFFLALALLPSLQLVPVMRWWSPHYAYVPFAFASMLVAEQVARQSENVQRIAAGAAALLAATSMMSDVRFADDVTLWTDEVRADPTCREAHFYLGEAAREQRRYADAAASYERAIAATPDILSYVDRVPALQNLGVVRLELGQFAEARAAFGTALASVVDEGYRRLLLHNLAAAELRGGNAEEAARLLESEVARDDALPASLFIRARAVEVLGRTDEARKLMRRLQSRTSNGP